MHRPVIAFAPGDNPDELKGSGRSIEGIHMRDLLARVDSLAPNLIEKFGGHAMAAGLSLKKSKFNTFQKVAEQAITEMTEGFNWQQQLLTDGQLQAEDFTQQFAEQLKELTPWGQAFPEPVFEGEFEIVEARQVGDSHVKMKLKPTSGNLASGQILDAICFAYLRDHSKLPSGIVKAIYRLDINEFRGDKSLQLMVQELL
jgi:single-stranded-DNA-specific exonuclease